MTAYKQTVKNVTRKAANKVSPLTKNFWIFAVILAVLAAAQITLFAKPVVGVYLTAAALAILVGLALWKEKARQLAVGAAILPAATMISLSLPPTMAFARIVVFYDAILILALIYRFAFTLDYPLQNTSLTARGYALALPLMAVIGQILGLIGYGMLRHQYGFAQTALPLVAAAAVVFAISEEMLFRGLIQQRGSLVLHPAMAAVLSSLLYASYTFGHQGSWLSPLFGLLMGIVLSIIYYKKPNLILTITVNSFTKLTYVALMAAFIFR